jgi:Spy/CpxP family protein refolding chaperone
MLGSWKSLLITALVAALFGFAGAELSLARQKAEVPQHRAGMSESINLMLEQQVDPTQAQKASIATINDRYTKQRNLLLAELYMERAQLGGAFSENMTLSGPTRNAIAQMQASVGELQTLTINYIIDLRKVLTPTQRQVFDQKVVEMLMRDNP